MKRSIVSTTATFYLLLSLFSLTGCDQQTSEFAHTFDGPTMGTYYRISILGLPEESKVGIDLQIKSVLANVNQLMSTYLDSSEVTRFNHADANHAVQLSESTATVIRKALMISELTHGAFDITVGPLVDQWGFGPNGSVESEPKVEDLKKARLSVGWQQLRLEGRMLFKTNTATQIDLSAIAKGFAIDQLAELLNNRGYSNWLIDVGGELRAQGRKSTGAWQVAIERPSASGGIEEVIDLNDKAVATSGDYRNFVILDGEVYSHAIDPDTGYPLRHNLASVSVLHESAATADALATALLIMGTEKAHRFANKHGLSVFLIARTEDDSQFRIIKTRDFASTSH